MTDKNNLSWDIDTPVGKIKVIAEKTEGNIIKFTVKHPLAQKTIDIDKMQLLMDIGKIQRWLT